ncbi:MAG: phosphate acyltransferase PlsX [Mycoplasmatales bacterium]
MYRVGIDVQGADKGIKEIVLGVKEYYMSKQDIHHQIFLFGPEDDLLNYFSQVNLEEEKVTIIDCPTYISNNEDPLLAMRTKKDSSIVVASKYLKEDKVDVIISAGSTGALVSVSTFIVGRTKGVDRVALGGMLPAANNKPTLILDLGANIDAKEEHLIQYAKLGIAYLKVTKNIQNPTLSLLNIGTEAKKGSEFYQNVYRLLEEDKDINFLGNIEPRDLMSNKSDIILMDGFSGNIMLKTLEGTIKFMGNEFKGVLTKNIINKIAASILYKDLKNMYKKYDYRELGATPIFGANKLVMKAHGSSDKLAFKNAIIASIENLETDYMKEFKG